MTKKVLFILRTLFALVYVLLGITFIIPLIFTAIFYNYLFGFRCERTTSCSRMDMYPDLKKEKMDFYSGKTLLDAACYTSKVADGSKGLLVFCHGIGCGKDNYINRIDYFTKQGFVVFAYDMTGVCDSGGKGQRGVPQATLDLKCALEFVATKSQFDGMPVVVYSHSWCGFAAASVLNYGDFGIKALVTCGGFNTSSDISRIYIRKFMGSMDKLVMPYVAMVEYLRFGKVARYKAI
ncbi:MAG: alpha/beta hydrolase, partial [Clostridia bacterium]